MRKLIGNMVEEGPTSCNRPSLERFLKNEGLELCQDFHSFDYSSQAKPPGFHKPIFMVFGFLVTESFYLQGIKFQEPVA